ncbi:hypothetical protein OPT61_g7804 [Boeremia exigua]|uniref:Uncharacterized protein n=1 Tax=Boeremia exigua TaxID=749465 RepID=A0ACC2I1H0_9PLEO|nr:hypothetical protein OPT61_g7804 [Boeremia exigua]
MARGPEPSGGLGDLNGRRCYRVDRIDETGGFYNTSAHRSAFRLRPGHGVLTFAAVAGTLSAAAIGASATSSSAARHVESLGWVGWVGKVWEEIVLDGCRREDVEGQCGALYHGRWKRSPTWSASNGRVHHRVVIASAVTTPISAAVDGSGSDSAKVTAAETAEGEWFAVGLVLKPWVCGLMSKFRGTECRVTGAKPH